MTRRTMTTAALVALLTALPAVADLHYKARTWQEGDKATEQLNTEVEAWIRDGEADIRFVDSGSPLMPAGTRLVVQNAANEIYLVNDEEETVSPWNLDEIFAMASAVMQGMGPMLKIQIQNAKVETLLEEPGGTIAGYSTTRYRFLTEYDLVIKVIGIGQKQHVRTVQDSWFTDAFDDAALGVWLKREPPDFGDGQLAELIRLEQGKMKGFPLKTVIEETSVGKKGKNESTTRTITEVTLLEDGVTAPAGSYSWPSHYKVVQQMPDTGQMAAEQPEEEEGEKKGRFKRLLGRGDDG